MNSFEKYFKKWYPKKKQLQTSKKNHEFSTILKNKNHLEVQFSTPKNLQRPCVFVCIF